MSCCLVPGQVIILPKPDGGPPLDSDESLLYSSTKWLAANDIAASQARGIPAPYVRRVPIGEELEWAMRLVKADEVIAAMPNYHVRPGQNGLFCEGHATLNQPAVDLALRQLGALWPAIPANGAGTTVLVIDSGYHPGNLDIRRLDACDPVDEETAASAVHGTVVTELILRIAPHARITSARALGSSRTLAGVLTALYLAEAWDPPDVVNLSFSVSSESGRCRACGYRNSGDFTAAQIGKSFGAIASAPARRRGPVWVAAAGNDPPTGSVAMPASLANVIAVGSYDSSSGEVPGYAAYREVPAGRFVMAFGGSDSVAGCIARTDSLLEPRLFGTSFAAPLITGLIARYVGAVCAWLPQLELTPLVLAFLRHSTERIPGHDEARHGLGNVRFAGPIPIPNHAAAGWLPRETFLPGNDRLPDLARERVQQQAYLLWASAGRPAGRDLEFWLAARNDLGVPRWLE